jgi:hypothetical protein
MLIHAAEVIKNAGSNEPDQQRTCNGKSEVWLPLHGAAQPVPCPEDEPRNNRENAQYDEFRFPGVSPPKVDVVVRAVMYKVHQSRNRDIKQG